MTRRKRSSSSNANKSQWYQFDLHIHTPASLDYPDSNISYLDILKVAVEKNADILAFTDHNTVAGYKRLEEEIDNLELLERLNRLTSEEAKTLGEYRDVLDKILLLKGFEFTATFGFHILGIFPPETPVRDLEFLLLQLHIPVDRLDKGETEVGATVDVLTAYKIIRDAGGIVIAAHANSSHGVALQGLGFGGQTRIAFTQDPNLHALEVTDLEKTHKKTTARFFDGSKPEYPRRMRCVQSSDAHHLRGDPKNPRNQGVGDRMTEVLLNEKSFEALKDVFEGGDFAHTRPYRPSEQAYDFIQVAREEGPNIVQEFHERYSSRGGYLDAIIADICAFANTNGGTLYVGVPNNPQDPPNGVGTTPTRVVNLLEQVSQERITPQLNIKADVQETKGVKVVRVVVPKGKTTPYAMDENQIFIRTESETTQAVRDEIVELAKRGLGGQSRQPMVTTTSAPEREVPEQPTSDIPTPPRTGVEIAEIVDRNNTKQYTMRDLRNGNLVKNVTRRSARHLWRYAIDQSENSPVNEEKVRWLEDIGIWQRREQGTKVRYDLVQREGNKLRVYYGVTEEGIHGKWSQLTGE